MSILYTKIQQINPQDPEGPRKWYISPNRIGQKSEKEIAEALAKNTTLSRGEASLVIDELQAVILSTLLDGYTVQMGDWGTFQLTVSSEGTDTEAKSSPDKIKGVNIRFRPGRDMKDAIARATFAPR